MFNKQRPFKNCPVHKSLIHSERLPKNKIDEKKVGIFQKIAKEWEERFSFIYDLNSFAAEE